MNRRHDGRSPDDLRSISIETGVSRAAAGSALIRFGETRVLCTASFEAKVPPWLEGKGKGWVTAEYNMLPCSTRPRKPRERSGKVDGRTTEIQRLIGRSLRAIVDLELLGEQMLTIDCDVLDADGGTRTASITGAMVALVEALQTLSLPKTPLRDSVAAISVGIVDGLPVLDLDYQEDVGAEVDMNIVMTGNGRFIEIQGTGEEATFSEDDLHAQISLARQGIRRLTEIQRNVLGDRWPWRDVRA